jgi:hypothetical protein
MVHSPIRARHCRFTQYLLHYVRKTNAALEQILAPERINPIRICDWLLRKI